MPIHRTKQRGRQAKRTAAAAAAAGGVSRQLPSHWPRFVTPEYYAWVMARMPPDAIAADWAKHQPHNSYGPIFWYEDKAQKCVQCGVEFVFTKEEQQTWYEEYKIPIYAYANRCGKCHSARRKSRQEQRGHMAEMARRPVHPREAFFKRKA